MKHKRPKKRCLLCREQREQDRLKLCKKCAMTVAHENDIFLGTLEQLVRVE
jgi:hypothetical protein